MMKNEMNLGMFRKTLAQSPQQRLVIKVAGDTALAPHFHVTEVGLVTKDFVDCGGVRRSDRACVLQTLVAYDTDHRLTAAKLAGILSKVAPLQLDDHLPVDVEVQGTSIETWRVAAVKHENDRLLIELAPKQTACLAQDQCGIPALPVARESCCGDVSNCC